MSEFIPITFDNFDEQKKRAIKVLEQLQFDDLNPNFSMSFKQGMVMGNHANDCDSCNLLHYLMAYAINQHRLDVGK